jgi:hypothetical protein
LGLKLICRDIICLPVVRIPAEDGMDAKLSLSEKIVKMRISPKSLTVIDYK